MLPAQMQLSNVFLLQSFYDVGLKFLSAGDTISLRFGMKLAGMTQTTGCHLQRKNKSHKLHKSTWTLVTVSTIQNKEEPG